MPLYEFECYKGHRYEGVRPVSHSGHEGCEVCEAQGWGFSFAHRVISRGSVHIPGRAVGRKFVDDTIEFAEKQTKIAEAKARKVQTLR